MLNINTNIMSLTAQNNLSGSQSALSQAIGRLSSGKRVNTAADDAAGLAISTTQTASINALTQGAANANNGISMVQTTNGALQSIVSNLQRIRQLAVEAGDGSLDSNALANLQSEVSTRLTEITRVAQQTTFNGQSVLSGIGTINFQIGAFDNQRITADFGSQKWDAGSLGVSGLSVSNASGAQAAMSTIDSVLTSVNTFQGNARRNAEYVPGCHLDDEHASNEHEFRAFADHRRGLRDRNGESVEGTGAAAGGHLGAGAGQFDAADRAEAARVTAARAEVYCEAVPQAHMKRMIFMS